MNNAVCLSDMKPGESAHVKQLKANGNLRRRFLDIGLIEQTTVTCVGKSPLGDPIAFSIRGAVIAIRLEDCDNILIEP
ncbi:MAG: FeoA family protein [Lachnospiraceae bacterium]